MPGCPPCPPNARWLTPYLVVGDVRATLALYEQALGFAVEETVPGPDGGLMHAGMSYKGKLVTMMGPEGGPGVTARTPAGAGTECPIGLYLYVDDVDDAHARACAAGMSSLASPEDMFWGDRICRLADADGYRWTLATNVGEFDPSAVPGRD